jgi:hypothetical protein
MQIFSCYSVKVVLLTSSVKKKKLPALSFANSMYLGLIPSELKDLIMIKEAMIA